ncbi:MAG: hypothetical protein ACTSX6_01620, partial [Candidatus Heimdallarchaeaceae archaeon]
TDVQVANLEVDSDLKLLYVGSVFGVDVLNYTEKPLNATPLLTGIAMNFEIGDFIDIDPATHYAWIVSQSNGLYVYDPFTEKFADISGYNVPAASVEMLTVEVNTSAGYAFIGSKQGLYMVDTTTNTTYWFDNTKNLPYNEVKLVKYYPSLMKTFIATFHPSSGICGGMSVLNMSSLSIQNYNWTVNPYNPRAIIDLAVDVDRELGYIASFYFDNAESGFLVFNTTDMTGIAKSTAGGYYPTGVPTMTGSPEIIDSLLAQVELNSLTGDIFLGTVQRIQKVIYTPPTTAITENSPILGLQHNVATDVVYDPIGDKVYISTLLGLDRVDPHTRLIEHLMPPPSMGGAGGDTSGALAENARMFYHHRYEYNITSGAYRALDSILPFAEFGYVKDIVISKNESLVFYSTETQDAGYSDNGSLIIFNRLLDSFSVFDFGFNKSELSVNQVLEDPTSDILYIATNHALIIFNLTTLTEISRYGESEGWNVQSLEWIDGKLWLGMEPYPNIRIFDPSTTDVTIWNKADQIVYPSINTIYYLSSRNETYILANSGLYVLNRTNDVLKYETEAEGLSTLFLRAMDYVPTTDEVWIGSFQGINIYNPNFDNVTPSLSVSLAGTEWSGNVSFSADSSDYSGIKEIRATFKNTTFSIEWVVNLDHLDVTVETLDYANGDYILVINATDNNNLLSSVSYNIIINNQFVGEYSTILSLGLFSALAILTIFLSRRKNNK